MNRQVTRGFTIIETMLFLGITGLLIFGLLGGIGASVNSQRYRDSVTSLQSFLQQQYSDVNNVNNYTYNNSCYTETNKLRGQSDCVILGKYITSSNVENIPFGNGSRSLVVKTVLGYTPSQSTLSLDDVQIFLDSNGANLPDGYNVEVIDGMTEEYDIEWGSGLKDLPENGGNAADFSVLILRSPNSGVIKTFISPDVVYNDSKIQDLVQDPASLKNPLEVCVDSSTFFSGARLAIFIRENASSPTAVETLGSSSGC